MTDKGYFEYIKDTLSQLDGVSFKPMMGEYILYYNNKIAGGLYDNRLLVKPISAALRLLPGARYELPYDGAKPMLFVENTDSSDFLCELLTAMYDELPEPKKNKKQ